MATTAEQIMGARGADVVTAAPAATLGDVAATLHARGIGAVVVLEDDGRPVGIVSERDIVRHAATQGVDCLQVTVAEAMTGSVTTCEASPTTDELMQLMTDGRFRHVPVVDDDGGLFGIVSIGDVVKSTIERLEVEKKSLAEYVTGGY
jgi:CBS domain-containing protein